VAAQSSKQISTRKFVNLRMAGMADSRVCLRGNQPHRKMPDLSGAPETEVYHVDIDSTAQASQTPDSGRTRK
jgi:hypothetical protein